MAEFEAVERGEGDRIVAGDAGDIPDRDIFAPDPQIDAVLVFKRAVHLEMQIRQDPPATVHEAEAPPARADEI